MEENSIVEERENLMVPPTNEGLPTFRKAHFLKPIYNPTNQLLPKHPSICLPLNTKTKKLKERVVFKCRLKPHKSWNIWVENLQKTHELSWKRAGIYDAIRCSTYEIKEDNELIIGLVEKWCPDTNTFVFPWGEASITLEDVMILGGFSVFGFSVLENSCNIADDHNIVKKLNDACAKIKKDSNVSNVSHLEWMNYFKGYGGEMENVALIVLWLSRYVFTSFNVYRIAVSLARGTRIALAPAVLALIYRDLSLLKKKILSLNCEDGQGDGSKLVLWAPFQLIQVWAWERFRTLGPKPEPLVHGEPRLARWHGMNGVGNRRLRVEIESAGGEFLWRPYALYVRNWEFPKFYCDEEMWVLVDSEVDEELLSFGVCLRVCELVGVNCVKQYLPHRVAMQFGMDQDIPISIPRLNADVELAWSSYDKPLHGLKFYITPRLLEGDITIQYSNWWKTLDLLPVEKPIQRNRKTKVKKLSQILQGSKEGNCKEAPLPSSSPCTKAVELDCLGNSREMPNEKLPSSVKSKGVQDIVIDLLLGLDDNRKNELNAIEEDREKEVNESNAIEEDREKEVNESNAIEEDREKEVNELNAIEEERQKELYQSDGNLGVDSKYSESTQSQNEIPVGSSSQCNVEMYVDFAGSSSNRPCGKSTSCEHREYSEGACSPNEKLIEDNGTFSGARSLIKTETTPLCGAIAEDVHQTVAVVVDIEQMKPSPDDIVNVSDEEMDTVAVDDDIKQMKTSPDAIVIVSDEEMDDDLKSFEAKSLEIDARLNRLEKIVSSL